MAACLRLKQDYLQLKKEPIHNIEAEPSPSNFLQWHYVFRGPKSTPYEGGYYYGILMFPKDYPFKPPGIYMYTPNGRFKTTKICLTMSDFHPEFWTPAWNVSTILLGVLSFMTEEPTSTDYFATHDKKRELAKKSLQFNLQNKVFCELFPDIEIEIRMALKCSLDDSSKEKEVEVKNSEKEKESQ